MEITALPQFPCFRNLSDFNLKWWSVIKSTTYKQRKSNTFNRDSFSHAAWFAISMTWIKNKI